MASFVPNHRKKKIRLARKENILRRLIEQKANAKKLLETAIEVREARVRVLRSKLSENPNSYEQRSIVLAVEREIDAIQNTSAEAILSEFQGDNVGQESTN